MKFARDRQTWLRWLFEAKKRFGLRILNYIITSNHIHLLAVDDGERDVIPRSLHLLGYEGIDDIREAHRVWVEDALKGGKYNVRDYKWTESVAVGSGDFVEKTKEKLGIKIKGRKITENNGVYELKESNTTAYGNDYSNKIDAIRSENTYFWESIPCKSEG